MSSASEALWVAAPRPAAAGALEEAGHPSWLAGVLARRGVADARGAGAFLEPRLPAHGAPAALAQLPAAVERLAAGRARGESVAVVADYDVDGITAAAQLLAVLRACAMTAVSILPERLREGYGFQPEHAVRAADSGCGLIITADCGSGAHAAVAAARERGLDVIITDHHLGHGPAPGGALEVNPRRCGASDAAADLCGAGLAFKLASAFGERCGRPVSPTRLLRLACLGTIADMVPLTRENRVIAALGLEALPATRSLGLQALLRHAGAAPPLTSEDVAFRIAPRLNAAGRMANAGRALELLLTRDPSVAEELAAGLEEHNRDRRSAQELVVEESTARFAALRPLPGILVEWSADWHRGVVGIAAGRIARDFHRPTLLFSVAGELAVGSGRSLPGIHLFEFLEPWGDALVRFGGHAQAVGLSAASERLPALRAAWQAAAAGWPAELLLPTLEYEASLPPDALDEELLARLQRLEPFGIGNPEPRLRVGPLRLLGSPRPFGRGHLSAAAFSASGRPLSLVGWGWGERAAELAGEFEALGCWRFDRYREGPVFQLEAARPWRPAAPA
ncbi:MAG: single-stranded-DNA-specific exonuclease RecJ [Thermoanaerobaculia bacterium]